MKCPKCGKEMKEETLFTSIEYKCNCADDGWQSIDQIKDFLSPMDFPLKLRFKDNDGTNGGVFISDMTYFDRCPKDRKFKVQRAYDPYVSLKSYSDSDDDGC